MLGGSKEVPEAVETPEAELAGQELLEKMR
jgi:hypothetical protein